MKQLDAEVVVIGGGATGTGLVRDLAMRGFKTILVEKGDLASGTTGRFHGLLHSGGRYVVKDPQAAKECIEENRILRKIMPFCIEDTGGLFVLTPWDDLGYVSKFTTGCQFAGIPCEEVKLTDLFSLEPYLNREITRSFRLPDASVDSFIAAEANATSGINFGAQVFSYYPVTNLVKSENKITGVICHDLRKDEVVQITADLVVNAAGAWVDKLLSTAGIYVKMVHGKGTMLAINHRIVNTVINRCKMPADGDIIVPSHTVAVLGTTDIPISNPDNLMIEPWEVDLIIQEGEKVIPGISNMRFLRAWSGVRPLYQSDLSSNDRDISRAFVLLDHADRDGVDGILTITSGKWTTYRKMAEKTADLVCNKLKTSRKCRTSTEELPDPEIHHQKKNFFLLGSRLKRIEKKKEYGQIICECELVTYADVIHSLTRRNANNLSDLRRDTRLGMGPCQGCFCTLRAAGIWYSINQKPVNNANQKMLDYINDRWKGIKPILWGQQLKQEYLNLLVYKSLLQLHHLKFTDTDVAEQNASEDTNASAIVETELHAEHENQRGKDPLHPQLLSIRRELKFDVAVIGMGLSGLIAAWRLAKRGLHVGVVGKGLGAIHFHTGCIDILGFQDGRRVSSPLQAVQKIKSDMPDHPYSWCQETEFATSISELTQLCDQAGYPLEGSIQRNWLLPTAVGASRPTCLAPSTMTAGDLNSHLPILVVGIKDYFDFFPKLISHNLSDQQIQAEFGEVDLSSDGKFRNLSARRLAGLIESGELMEILVEQIQKLLEGFRPFKPQRIALPAVLGIGCSKEIVDQLVSAIEIPFFEVPTLPPSIPGIRLENILTQKIREYGGVILNGAQVIISEKSGLKINRIFSQAAAGHIAIQAKEYVLATGGILGGGITHHYGESLMEPIFNLPVTTRNIARQSSQKHFLDVETLPFTACGIRTNSWYQPISDQGNILYENLHCIGASLFGVDFTEELSSEGVALVTGTWIGDHLV